jgi:hypothetical protein
MEQLKLMQELDDEERTKIYDLIDMAISYHKTKKAYAS